MPRMSADMAPTPDGVAAGSGRLARRGLLRLTACIATGLAAPLARPRPAAAAIAAPPIFAEGAGLMVAGPPGGALDRTAERLATMLARSLPAGTVLRRDAVGGVDGVTGCNSYETQVAPDGSTALILPGAALLAWLIGDPRARYDVGRFVPVMAGMTPCVLVSRRPLAEATARTPLRVAASRPDSADLAGLLGLDVVGLGCTPLLGHADPAAAVLAGAADAALLWGAGVPERAQRLAAQGVRPVLSVGAPGAEDTATRLPEFPEVPTLYELHLARHGAPPAGALYAVWRAASIAAQLDYHMVLLSPSPAAAVALWRQAAVTAGEAMGEAGDAAAAVAGSQARPIVCPALNQFAAPLAVDAAALLELRRWLADRLRWQPG